MIKDVVNGWSGYAKSMLCIIAFVILGSILFAGCINVPHTLPEGYESEYIEYIEKVKVMNQTTLAGGTEAPGGVSWLVYAITAVFLMGTAAIVLYMLGAGLNIEPLKRYATSELLQTVASAILIAFIVALLYGLYVFIIDSFMGGPEAMVLCGAQTNRMTVKDPIKFAECKTQEKLDRLNEMWDTVYRANEGMERLTSTCIMLLGINVYCFDWSPGLRKQVGMAHTLADRITTLEVILHMEYGLLQYVFANMLVWFLPLGLVLRVLPPTRGAGGMLIALAIGFYFIYPTLIFVMDPSYARPELNAPLTFDEGDMTECYQGFRGAVALATNTFLIDQGGLSMVSYETVANRLTYLTMEAIYIPFVAFVVTLLFVKTLSALFGAEPSHMMRLVTKLG